MPTDRMRNGDFGEALTGRVLGTDPLGRPIMENAIYDPRTHARRSTARSSAIRFPNNVIPQDLLDPVALKIQDYIPRATRRGHRSTTGISRSRPIRSSRSPRIKVDHNFTGIGGKLSGYYSQVLGSALQRIGWPADSDHESAALRDGHRHRFA